MQLKFTHLKYCKAYYIFYHVFIISIILDKNTKKKKIHHILVFDVFECILCLKQTIDFEFFLITETSQICKQDS